MQSLLIPASVSYIVIFIIGVIVVNKVKMTKKAIIFSFIIFSLSLSILAYYLIPPLSWDLGRHFYYLDNIRNSNISLSDFLFRNRSAIGGSAYTSLVAFNCIRYLLVRVFDNNHMLPGLCILVDYLIISYIMVDWSSENAKSGKVKFTSLLLCFSFLPLVYAVSGIRTALAASIMGLGIYLYLYKGKSIVIFIFSVIIAVTIHPVMLIAVLFVFLARFEIGNRGMVIVFFVSLTIERIATYLSSSKYSYLARVALLYKRYTSTEQYREGGRMPLAVDIILICILLGVYFIMRKKLEKQFWNKNHTNLYSFLMYYMCFIIGNIGNYDMILRPAYLLGVFAPVLASLITNTEEWYCLNNKLILYPAKFIVVAVCIYGCYRYTILFMQGY